MKYNLSNSKFLILFGVQVGKIRKGKNLSFRQLAQKCDIDFGDLNKIEKGKQNITLFTLHELSKGLEIHPKELFDFDFIEEKD